MVAVARALPAAGRRPVLVDSTPAASYPGPPVPAATYRRRRLVAGALVAALVAVVVVALSVQLAPAPRSSAGPVRPRVAPPGVHVVQRGDTFWDIAVALRPDGDPRPLVARLVAAHGGGALRVGERIPLPAGG